MPPTHPFTQVDVFGSSPCAGNPLAVVHDADGLSDEQMARFARWTNLSETVFLCPPTTDEADYRVRIWTTGGELPFAGHPTLGSAHAWLAAGGRPRRDGVLVQECGVGLVPVRREEVLAFAAPDLLRSGPVAHDLRDRVLTALGLAEELVRNVAWVDNGPGWIGVECDSAATVLTITPDIARFGGLKLTVAGRHTEQDARRLGTDVEVRAFFADGRDFAEDPVTGSANAGLAQWLIGAGRLPASYVARQGTAIGFDGRVRIESRGDSVWVGGTTQTVIRGEVDLSATA